MIISHTHPLYKEHQKQMLKESRYNGAYYYSCDIVKYIIPNVQTDRKWITVRIPELNEDLSHSIVFIHNNRNPNYYEYLKNYKDCIMVCSQKHTADNLSFFGKTVVLPLSVNIDSVKKYYRANKDRDIAFAGRRIKITNRVPATADILTDMPQTRLIQAMAHYKKIYAVGRTAIQAKILGCEIGMYDSMYPDPNVWKIIDCLDAAKMLQDILNEIDGVKNESNQ